MGLAFCEVVLRSLHEMVHSVLRYFSRVDEGVRLRDIKAQCLAFEGLGTVYHHVVAIYLMGLVVVLHFLWWSKW